MVLVVVVELVIAMNKTTVSRKILNDKMGGFAPASANREFFFFIFANHSWFLIDLYLKCQYTNHNKSKHFSEYFSF